MPFKKSEKLLRSNPTPIAAFPERKIRIMVWTLLFLSPIVGMAVDLVAPSLPAIASGLGVLPSVAKGVISIYLLGYALGNFITGFLTDALGRQKLLRIGLLGFVLASLAPVILPTIQVLLITRFLQGLTIGGVAVVARSIYSDILPPEKLIRLGPLLGTMWGLGPIIGPVIGGYLQFYFGWQAGFCFFTLISLLMLILVFIVIPETHRNQHPLHFKTMRNSLLEVVNHRLFLALILLMGLTYSLMIIFNTSGPFLIQTQFHYTPVYFGHLALCLGVVFLMATILCRSLLKRFKTEQLFLVMIHALLLFAIVLTILSYFFAQNMTLTAVGSAIMFFGSGFIFPMAMGKGMSLFRHIPGVASAVMYLVNVLLTSLAAFLVSFISMRNVIPLMWIYLILVGLCAAMYWCLIYKFRESTGSELGN